MTKLKQLLYSKHSVLNIPDLFKWSVAKSCRPILLIMVNYLNTLITTFLLLHLSTNIKHDLLFCRNIISPDWKRLQVSILKIVLVQNLVQYSWKFKISFALFIWKTTQKRPAILPIFSFHTKYFWMYKHSTCLTWQISTVFFWWLSLLATHFTLIYRITVLHILHFIPRVKDLYQLQGDPKRCVPIFCSIKNPFFNECLYCCRTW